MTTIFLPRVHCEYCKRLWGNSGIYHPSINCPPSLIKRIKNLPEFLSVDDFLKLRKTLSNSDPSIFDFAPGSQLGIQSFDFQDVPPDFVYDHNCSLISEKALSLLAEKGIVLYTGAVNAFIRKKKLRGWRAVDFPDLRLLAKSSLQQQGLQECPRCGEFTSSGVEEDAKKILYGDSDHELIAAAWPKGLGLARIMESGWRVASPAFIAEWKRCTLTGLKFVQIGIWK